MKLDVENLFDSGVTITEIEVAIAIPVTIKPGDTCQLSIPVDHCTLSATYDDHGLLKTIKRVAPVTGDTGKIIIMKNSDGSPYIQ